MRATDFHYELPSDLVAQHPLEERGASRLLALDGASGAIEDHHFSGLVRRLQPGDLLVFNNTKVIAARVAGRKRTGGRVEVLVERVCGERHFRAQVRASKSPKPGAELVFDTVVARVLGRCGDLYELELPHGPSVAELLRVQGSVPLPPYIKRSPDEEDSHRYQTVYAEVPGAVAAPTAGLHFDRPMLSELETRGVECAYLTLHVGAGTFSPLRSDDVNEHVMHPEQVMIDEPLAERVACTRARGGRVVAVGTTTVRALEAAGGRAFNGDTRLFIKPGYRFSVVDAMVTNFHLPGSTLLMLVCAFAGTEVTLAAYRHAVSQRYRFFSYGDAMFVTPKVNP